MPMLSPTMEHGKLVEWNFAEGDFMQPGDYICEVETDKAIVGYEMLDEGFLAKILVDAGTSGVPLGEVIFFFLMLVI